MKTAEIKFNGGAGLDPQPRPLKLLEAAAPLVTLLAVLLSAQFDVRTVSVQAQGKHTFGFVKLESMLLDHDAHSV